MEALFIACAALGGTLLVTQFLLTLMGLGHHDAGFDHDFSGDAAHGLGDNLGGDASHAGNLDGHAGTHDAAHPQADHANWFFKAISIRTLVAAITFFGLGGLGAVKADLPWPQPLLIALGSGAAAMYGVYFIMQSLYRLKADGTERIARSIGAEGTVYLSIPGHHAGPGKIHFSLQNRLVEYQAVTSGEALPTGAKVVVVGLIGPDTVEVEPASQTARTHHV
ncbi:MAG: NfeD family protein [Planctomycetia bacterium]|nr:NfeD family protein [Planctomycetia bacterium]